MHDSGSDAKETDLEPWRVPAAAQGAAAILILGVAAGSLRFFYTRGLTNIYGDALAHMEGARRILDSLTPGYPEIGSVWLPLFHVICAPLAQNDFLWRTGLAGSLVSSAAFVVMSYFLFRLGAEINRNVAAGFAALAGVLLCPNFLYLASTPLTEPLALLWSVLVVYALFRYSHSGSWRMLGGAAAAAFLGTLTRYEAWYILPFATLFVFLARREPWDKRFWRAALFAGVAGAGPLLWVLHNAYRFHNPLEFYNGPYSAQAIYAHQLATTAFPYPTTGSLQLSARYYLEDLKLVLGVWALELAILGLVAWCASSHEFRRGAVALLFVVPLPFYIQALAYASVPLYVPTLFPNTYYNLRYGLEMLPAVALYPSFVLSPRLGEKLRVGLLVVFLFLLGWQFQVLASAGPQELVVVKEGILNSPCRSERQQAIIKFLRGAYDGQRLLVAAGKWPCVMPAVGIHFRNTLSEANREYWIRMRTEPEKWVEWIIRGNGDSVDDLMRAYPAAFRDFEITEQGAYPGEGAFWIYRRRRP
jgi:hypothetical protein